MAKDFLNGFKKKLGTDDSSYDEYESSYYDEFDGNAEAGDEGAQAGMQDDGMSGIGGMGGISLSGSALELKVVKPQNYNSAPQIADHLLSKRTVVLNLENTNKETARRLIDFLSGVAYSIDGSLKKIATNAYVITPSNVEVGDAQLKDKKAKVERQPEPDPIENIDNDDLADFS